MKNNLAVLNDHTAISPSPEKLQAIDNLIQGDPPKDAIKVLPVGGGAKYLSHVHVKKTLQKGLGIMGFDYNVLQYSVDPHDGSATVLGKLRLYVQTEQGEIIREFTETGAFEAYPSYRQVRDANDINKTTKVLETYWDGSPVYTMNTANRIASASSRAIVRCVATAFGYGLDIDDTDNCDLEPEDPEKLAVTRYNALLRYAERNDVSKKDFLDGCKNENISLKKLYDPETWLLAYTVIYNIKSGKEEQIPE